MHEVRRDHVGVAFHILAEPVGEAREAAHAGNVVAIGALAFDCVARRGVIGDDGAADEVSRIGARTNHVPVAGFYSYGEIARTHGPNGFHNQALVVLAVASQRLRPPAYAGRPWRPGDSH